MKNLKIHPPSNFYAEADVKPSLTRASLVISEHLKRIINTYGAAILLELSTNPSMFSCNNGPSGYSLATEALAILGLRKELLKGIA
jgi:hypothetical protein